jgi:L-threonylcarbamoyladenylate synthase
MKTRVWTVYLHQRKTTLTEHPAIQEAASRLREGALIAFPTETVYGLGADAQNDKAVQSIFRAKGRPGDNPLIVHIGEHSQLSDIAAHVPSVAEKLMDRFWPGPLTLVLPSAGTVSDNVTAGLPTVAVRLPEHPVARALLQVARCPVAAPSANRSGRPSPTEARHVLDDLDGRIDGVIDSGPTGYGLESTVLDVTGDEPALLRPGGITVEQLERVLGSVTTDPALIDNATDRAPRSPGMKYRHYAPQGEMTLVGGSEGDMVRRIQALADQYRAEGLKVGILTTEERKEEYRADVVVACGSRKALPTVARGLYRALRQFDDAGVERVLAESFPECGWGRTIMNRLRKAAGGRVI